MLAVKSMDVRDNFKILCEKVYKGETVFISRPKNENVVMISEKEYNEMLKAKKNAEYLAMLDKSIAEAEQGVTIYEEQGGDKSVAIYDMRYAKPLDEALVLEVSQRVKHIITIEDPIEFIHENKGIFYRNSIIAGGVPEKSRNTFFCNLFFQRHCFQIFAVKILFAKQIFKTSHMPE